MIPRRYVRFGLTALGLVFSVLMLAGCGSGPRLEGTVKLDGQPVDGGTITLLPTGEGAGTRPKVTGSITGGKYVLDSTRNLQTGTYRVELHWHKKTGKQLESSDPPHKIDETIQVIPKKYNADSKETIEITSSVNTKDFDLKSR